MLCDMPGTPEHRACLKLGDRPTLCNKCFALLCKQCF
jgi:hypothetical protein